MEELLNNKAIRAYILRLIGEEGLALLEKYPEDGEYSDEELAAKTGINLNSVRQTGTRSTKSGSQNIAG